MKKQIASTITVPSDKNQKFSHYSDGSELIPSEINPELENKKLLVSGYTMDDEGIISNYAVEPKLSEAPYPTPQQQKRYIFWGIGATGLVSLLLVIAFSVS